MPHLDYLPDEMGSARIIPDGAVEAGALTTLTYVYTAGKFGIDDTGGLKICFRATSDIGKPQYRQPTAANYVTATASNGVALDVMFDQRLNIRPWPQTVFVRTKSGYLREGDQITAHDLFLFEQTGVDGDGHAVGRFIATGMHPRCAERIEHRGIRLPADLFARRVLEN